MISKEMAERFHLPEIKKYPHPTRDWYWTFLCQSDYVAAKASESVALGEDISEYKEVLLARRYAREMINEIDSGTYNGEESMQEVDVVYVDELENTQQ